MGVNKILPYFIYFSSDFKKTSVKETSTNIFFSNFIYVSCKPAQCQPYYTQGVNEFISIPSKFIVRSG
jgi:hypothetical protein